MCTVWYIKAKLKGNNSATLPILGIDFWIKMECLSASFFLSIKKYDVMGRNYAKSTLHILQSFQGKIYALKNCRYLIFLCNWLGTSLLLAGVLLHLLYRSPFLVGSERSAQMLWEHFTGLSHKSNSSSTSPSQITSIHTAQRYFSSTCSPCTSTQSISFDSFGGSCHHQNPHCCCDFKVEC